METLLEILKEDIFAGIEKQLLEQVNLSEGSIKKIDVYVAMDHDPSHFIACMFIRYKLIGLKNRISQYHTLADGVLEYRLDHQMINDMGITEQSNRNFAVPYHHIPESVILAYNIGQL